MLYQLVPQLPSVGQSHRQTLAPSGIRHRRGVADQGDAVTVGLVYPNCRAGESGQRPGGLGVSVKFRRCARLDGKVEEASQVLLAPQAKILLGPGTYIGSRLTVSLGEEQYEQAVFTLHTRQSGVVGSGYAVQQNPGDHVPVRTMAHLESTQCADLGSPAIGPYHQTG